jgi:hypothetical protein
MLLARRALARLGAASRRLHACSSPAAAASAVAAPAPMPSMHLRTPLTTTTLQRRQQPLSTSSSSSVVAARATRKQPPSSSEGSGEEDEGDSEQDESLDSFDSDALEDQLDPGDEDNEEVAADEEVDGGSTPWGQAALSVARGILSSSGSDSDSDSQLSLWSFKAHAGSKRIEIRLDKPSDRYGSPSLDDVSAFSREFAHRLSEALGEEAAGEIEVEASSAGAARKLRLPRDLERFSGMPLAVSPRGGSAAAEVVPRPHPAPLRVVSVEEGGEGKVVFTTADVRATRGNRGRLTKKQLEARFEVAVSDLEKVTLYVDV